MSIIPDGPGAFAVNRPLPGDLVSQMVNRGTFCAGLINVITYDGPRANNKIIATNGDARYDARYNPRYDGGTLTLQNFWAAFAEPFDRWPRYPRGTLIGRYFRWEGARRGPGARRHVGVLLDRQDLPNRENGLLLHSHPGVGGLATTRLGASHAGWYYPLPLLLLLRREEGALDRARQGRVLMGAYLNARRKAVAPAWRSSPPPTVLWVFTEEIDAPEVGPLGVTALVTALIVERTPNAPVREG